MSDSICGRCNKDIHGGTTYGFPVYNDKHHVCWKCEEKPGVEEYVDKVKREYNKSRRKYVLTKEQEYATELHSIFCKGSYGESCDWYYKQHKKMAWNNSCQREYLKKAKNLLKLDPKFQIGELQTILKVMK